MKRLVPWLCLSTLGACGPVPNPAPGGLTRVAIVADAASPGDAASPAADAAHVAEPASSPPEPTPPAQHGWLDSPAWPSGDRLELTWLVTVVHDAVDPDSSKQPLSLVATIGGVSREIEFPRQLGALMPHNEPSCARTGISIAYPLGRHEVAKITFYEGGAGGFLVRRATPDVLEVVDWFQTDGACPDAKGEPGHACPPEEKPVVKLHVPADVKIHESITEIDRGVHKPFDCGSALE